MSNTENTENTENKIKWPNGRLKLRPLIHISGTVIEHVENKYISSFCVMLIIFKDIILFSYSDVDSLNKKLTVVPTSIF